MTPRTDRLIAEVKRWCDEERGRQTELAKLLGVSRQAVNHWLQRTKDPTSEQTLALHAFLSTIKARKTTAKT
jgi:DNA-binding transcriptional regulator YiaG